MATALPTGVDLEDNRGPEIIRAVFVVAILAKLALVARLAARRLKKTRLGASDYTVVVGWLMAWSFNINMYLCKCTPFQPLKFPLSLSHVDKYLWLVVCVWG